jgi:glycerate kinase
LVLISIFRALVLVAGWVEEQKSFLISSFDRVLNLSWTLLVGNIGARKRLIITGEGKMDEQTLSGKVVKGVADLSRKHSKPLIVVVGKNELSEDKTRGLGVNKVVTLSGRQNHRI